MQYVRFGRKSPTTCIVQHAEVRLDSLLFLDFMLHLLGKL